MTTLAANAPRTFEQGDHNDITLDTAATIYEGAAVGMIAGTGKGRPLVAGDRFVGFALFQARITASIGFPADSYVRVQTEGDVQLTIAGAGAAQLVITDVGQPVYASDDATFQLSPVGGSFIGTVKRWVSNGVAVVHFDVNEMRDPWGAWTSRVTLSANTTLDQTYVGKLIWVDTDAFTITLPAVATAMDGVAIVNGGGFGTIAVTVAPNASDQIAGPDVTVADNKALINTKATAQRGDFVVIGGNDADGMAVQMLRGTWARAA